jgi:Cof subfamily protein (haloacid dehalogenase superfamily)
LDWRIQEIHRRRVDADFLPKEEKEIQNEVNFFMTTQKLVIPSRIKYAFFDVDGTIMNSGHRISEATATSILSFKKRGGQYGLASGRPFFGAKKIIQALEVSGPSVFFSGALAVIPGKNQILLQEAVSPTDAASVLEFSRMHDLFIELYTQEGYFIDKGSNWAAIHAQYLGEEPKVTSLDRMIQNERILKLEFIARNSAEEKLLREYGTKNPNLVFGYGFGAAHPGTPFVNVTSTKASREAAFACILSHLGIAAEEIVAFGDAEADIPFLKLAGLGVAMGNANERVKAAADFVTKSVAEDGVSFVLDQL